jgi:multidrug efflux pump subunit AcrA (membrane-fusion protein)
MNKTAISILVSVVILAIAGALSMGLMAQKPEAKKTKTNQHVLKVNTSQVKNEIHETTMEYPARVQAFESLSLSAEVAGRIENGNIELKEGERFSKGSVLVRINKDNAEASLQAAKSNFLRTISSMLPDLSVDYPEEYPAWETFFTKLDINKKYPELPEINNTQLKVFMASKGVLSEYYNIRQLEITFDKYTIYAPFQGYYKSVNSQVGAFTANGAMIAQMVRSDKVEVIASLTLEDSQLVKENQEVFIKSGNKEVYGVIRKVADFVNPQTQSVNVYISCNSEAAHYLLEGSLVEVTFKTNMDEASFMIPREVIMANDEIYVVINNRIQKRKVKVLQHLDDLALVVGLNDNEEVVVESLINVKVNQEVATY